MWPIRCAARLSGTIYLARTGTAWYGRTIGIDEGGRPTYQNPGLTAAIASLEAAFLRTRRTLVPDPVKKLLLGRR
jgi:hypothetical protein